MIKVILFGYRDWAIEIFNALKENNRVQINDIIFSKEDYDLKIETFHSDVDFLLFIGWSWIIPPQITTRFLCLGIHPSDLPLFRGGSPIQHQVMAGLEKSKVTLMTLSSEKLDAGDIWLKEDLDLRGKNIKEIFSNITKSSIKMLNTFIDNFEKIKPVTQTIEEGSYFKRRTLAESRIKKEDIINWDLIQIYNFIRSLTDPYPNAFIEDEKGNRLYFKGVEYVEKLENKK